MRKLAHALEKQRMSFDSYFVLAGLAALLVGLSKGGLPTIGMLAVPLLSLFMSPVKAAVLLLPIYIISDVVSVWLYRKDFSAANLKILPSFHFLFVLAIRLL